MRKNVALLLSIVVLASPLSAFAQTSSQESNLQNLYTQLVHVLQQIVELQKSTGPTLQVAPRFGTLPLGVSFNVFNTTGTESIIFGDGSYSGREHCTINDKGWCDLRQPINHIYVLPGTYEVTMYRHVGKEGILVATSSVTAVVGSSTSPTGY